MKVLAVGKAQHRAMPAQETLFSCPYLTLSVKVEAPRKVIKMTKPGGKKVVRTQYIC